MNLEKKKRILVFSGYYLPGFKGGGPIRSISNMVDNLANFYDFSILTSDKDLGAESPYPSIAKDQWNAVGKADVYYLKTGFKAVKDLIRILKNEHFDIVSINSFFSFKFSIFPFLICRILNKNCQIVIAPRGEFSNGALGIKSLKKRLFINIAQFLSLYKNTVWHASSEFESVDIRRVMGDDAKIRVAMDISTPDTATSLSPRIENSPLRIIFVSRISPMKNLIGAIDILHEVKNNVIFEVYGPAEDRLYWEKSISAAKSLPDNINFSYHGPLSADEVPSKLAEFDLFFLPTLGENYGHVIAEALSAGLPVLISDATPWRNLAEKSIGWDIPLSQTDRFINVIDYCHSMSSEDYNAWRKRIRAWAVKNIGNGNAIEQNRQVFNSLN